MRPFPGTRTPICRAAVAAAALLGLVLTVRAEIDIPLFRAYLGVQFSVKPGDGAVIIQVNPSSPAEKADLKPGDRVLSVAGRAVPDGAAAVALISSYPPRDTIELVLERRGSTLVRKVTLSGWMRYEKGAGPGTFPVPGIDTDGEAAPPDLVAGLDRMNVLKRVLIDAETGGVEFIGTYDPRYATGPIPYRLLLEEACLYPEPYFSLEPDPQYSAKFTGLVAKKKADFDRLFGSGLQAGKFYDWVRDWLSLIDQHPLLEPERQAYLARLSAGCGLTEDELALLMNYATLYGVRVPVPPEVLAIQVKVLKNIGYESEARSYALYRDGSAKAVRAAVAGLGKEARASQALASPQAASGDEGARLARLEAFFCCELLDTITHSRLGGQRQWEQFLAGKIDLAGLDRDLQWNIGPVWDRSGRSLVFEALSGMPLSNEMIRIFYGAFPGRVALDYKGVSPSSALARILYEADYTAKTLDISQRIAPSIPDHKAISELSAKFLTDRNVNLIITLVPREVALYVPETRKEIDFGESRIELALHVEKVSGEADLDPDSFAKAEARGLAWTGQINDRYEDYARVYPPLHKLREAAKVLALAKWLLREKIDVQTGVRPVPVWEPPAEVPGLIDIRMSFGLVRDPAGKLSYDFKMPVWMVGGVNFRIKNAWVVTGPKPPGYVPIEDQLTTSAALGERAVQAALGGDLESARALSELGAQALTGDLDPARLPAGVGLAKTGPRKAASPEEVRLIKESLRAIRMASVGPPAGADPSSPAERTALLTELRDALRPERSDRASATDLLARLQARQRTSRPEDGAPVTPAGERSAPSEAPSFDCAAYLRQHAEGAGLGAGQKAFLDGKVLEIQEKLGTVRKAMDELGRLRQGDLEALQKCEGEISAAYAEAQDRALDALAMLLVDGPLDILKKRKEAMKGDIDQGLRKLLYARSGVLDEAAVAGLDRASFDLVRAKHSFETIYGRAERLQATLAAAKSLYDMGQWANSEKTDYQKIKEGTIQLVEMVLGDETAGGAFKLGKLTGAGILRFLSLYKAVDAASGFFWDIMAQRFAWGPLADQLQLSLETNLRAVRTLQERSRNLQNQLNCLRSTLR